MCPPIMKSLSCPFYFCLILVSHYFNPSFFIMKITSLYYPILSAILAATLVVSCQKQSDPKDNDTSNHQHTENSESSESRTSASEVESHSQANCPTGESCFICDPAKRETGRLWCKEHNRYEDRCWVCHPDLREKSRLFCSEHGVYEDECVICHPEVSDSKKSKKSSGRPQKSKVLMCNEHGVPEHECAICQPDLAAGLAPGESLKINLTSKLAAAKAGISTEKPSEQNVSTSVEAYCVADYNRDQVTQVTPLVEGVIRKINVSYGEKVKEGEILAILHSPELAEQKAEFLAAIAKEKYAKLNLLRQQRPAVKKVSSANRLESAEADWNVAAADLSATRQKLLNLDLTEEDINKLIQTQKPTAELPIRAPFGGTIVRREASVGKLATPGANLFTLVDLCSMWLELSIPASEVSKIALGMEVVATFNGSPNETYSGDLI